MADSNISIFLDRAVMKVFVVKLYLPMFLPVGVGYYLLFSEFHIIDVGIVFISAIIQALLSYQFITKREYPFSLPFGMLAEGDNTVKALLLMLLVLPFVILHFLSTIVLFGSYIYFMMLMVGAYLLWKAFLIEKG